MDTNTDTMDDDLEQVVARSCRMAARQPEIRRVLVVAGRRLTFAELARLRALAAALDVDLSMDGRGNVSLRPAAASRRADAEGRFWTRVRLWNAARAAGGSDR